MKLKITKLLFVAFFCYAAARFCHYQTSGFRISKISDNSFSGINFQDPPLTEEIEKLLEGKFTYFDRGLQSFAFLSEDGNYILKIFNNKLQKKHSLLKYLNLKEKAQETKKKLIKTFESYKIAYEELKEETGLLYLHLAPTSTIKKRIFLMDKLGICHSIDLDQTAFALQKKVTLAYPWLKELIDQNQLFEARIAIHRLMQLLIFKFNQGIADNDPLIRTNFGFINNIPLQIDIGPFSKNPQIQDPKIYLPELYRITASLKSWLEHYCPELVQDLDREIKYVEENP